MPGQGGSAARPGKGGGGRARRPRWQRILGWSALIGVVLLSLAAITIATVFWMYGRNLPALSKLSDYHPKQVTVVLDSEDQRIGEIFDERRSFIPYQQVPRLLVDAFVASEDAAFWTHGGLDYVGMARAFLANLRAGSTKQGASTITQQVVKTFILSPERTFKRKIQEIILARRLEQALTKEEIIALYVNQVYFGHGRYGVQEAARFYFGKDVSQINPGEAALLAGLVQSPENISPHKNQARAKERQTYVLGRLVETGKLAQGEAKRWIDAPIEVAKVPFPRLGSAPEWVELARQELVTQRGKDALPTLGAQVRTTLDVDVQAAAQKALEAGLRGLDARHKVGRPVRKVAADKVTAELARLGKKLPASGPARAEIYEAIVGAVDDAGATVAVDLGGYPATLRLGGAGDERFNPADAAGARKKPSERFAAGDVIEVVAAPADAKAGKGDGKAGPQVALAPGPQGAVVVLEVKTRKVRALVGGYGSRVADFNRATMAHRQPGSSFKPFVYAAALASGRYTAASIANDAPEVFDLWRPQNYKKDNFEGPVRLRHALAKSINTVAIRLAHEVGPAAVAELAAKLGITSKLPRELSLALGSGEVTPLELTNALASFAAGGRVAPPRVIESIDGKALAVAEPVVAIPPELAYVVLDMMRSVVDEGTAQLARKLGLTIAGKTGTSNDARDAWFIGLTPDYAIGVWIGYDDNRPLGRKETGGTTAVPIFVEVARAMGLRAKSFERPAGVVEARIDRTTGLLAPTGAPAGTSLVEVFMQGSAPTEVAPMPGQLTGDTLVTDEYGD
jgi:penicillin-binding protein 1A